MQGRQKSSRKQQFRWIWRRYEWKYQWASMQYRRSRKVLVICRALLGKVMLDLPLLLLLLLLLPVVLLLATVEMVTTAVLAPSAHALGQLVLMLRQRQALLRNLSVVLPHPLPHLLPHPLPHPLPHLLPPTLLMNLPQDLLVLSLLLCLPVILLLVFFLLLLSPLLRSWSTALLT
jgi:hypothetical protein